MKFFLIERNIVCSKCDHVFSDELFDRGEDECKNWRDPSVGMKTFPSLICNHPKIVDPITTKKVFYFILPLNNISRDLNSSKFKFKT